MNKHVDSDAPPITSDPQPAILVVDDEPYVREVLSRLLSSEGYQCTCAADADEAWKLLHEDNYALVVADLIMPGMTGMELLAKMHEKLPRVAVIMATGVDDRKTAIHALQAGAYGYIIKPFDANEVLINVANALERRRLTLQSADYQQRLEAEVYARTADVRRREEEIALRLVAASEFRDKETGSHIRRMGKYAAVLAKALGWTEEATDDIRVAATMHDIGKIGVADAILLKPGKLAPEEFEVMKTHTEIGARILDGSDIPLLNMAKDIALSHHEKWDGSGYPAGLAGDAIPQCARIVAVVDIYDALVHKRVYRDALPEQEALAVMSEESESRFDPEIYGCFLSILPEVRRIRRQISN